MCRNNVFFACYILRCIILWYAFAGFPNNKIKNVLTIMFHNCKPLSGSKSNRLVWLLRSEQSDEKIKNRQILLLHIYRVSITVNGCKLQIVGVQDDIYYLDDRNVTRWRIFSKFGDLLSAPFVIVNEVLVTLWRR